MFGPNEMGIDKEKHSCICSVVNWNGFAGSVTPPPYPSTRYGRGAWFERPVQLLGIPLQRQGLCVTAVSPVAMHRGRIMICRTARDQPWRVKKRQQFSSTQPLEPPAGVIWVWGRGFQRQAQLWRTSASGTQHRWQSLILCVFVRVWLHAHSPQSNSVHCDHKWSLKWTFACAGQQPALSVCNQVCSADPYQ